VRAELGIVDEAAATAAHARAAWAWGIFGRLAHLLAVLAVAGAVVWGLVALVGRGAG
jgi:hypothetical protein